MQDSALEAAVFSFEDVLPGLDLLPLAARRALDHAGQRLSLEGWRSLGFEDRRRLVLAGAAELVDSAAVVLATSRAKPTPQNIEPLGDPDPVSPPDTLLKVLGPSASVGARVWADLRPLDRYALAHAHRVSIARNEPDRLTTVARAIVAQPAPSRAPSQAPSYPPSHAPSRPPSAPPKSISPHVTSGGEVHMVDVGAKSPSARRAVATGSVRMQKATLARIARSDAPKGEVLATARIAGIMAAKRTPEIIPLCHTVALTRVEVHIDVDAAGSRVNVTAVAEAFDRTGVEMEALVATSAACLTIYDMLKGVDREMVVSEILLLEKSGGRTGTWRRGDRTGG